MYLTIPLATCFASQGPPSAVKVIPELDFFPFPPRSRVLARLSGKYEGYLFFGAGWIIVVGVGSMVSGWAGWSNGSMMERPEIPKSGSYCVNCGSKAAS